MKEICPICGSKEIVCVDKSANRYRCKSCDEVFAIENKPKAFERNVEKTLTPAEIYKNAIDSVFELSCDFGEESTSGTGFYISRDGFILTNCHVIIDRKPSGKFVLSDKVYACKSRATDYRELEIVYIDHKNDLALLKENGTTAKKALRLAKHLPAIGESVVAIGNSKGEGLLVVNGIVSDTDREFMGHSAFLFNALVANGCSGGPIFNDRGEVCGVTVGARDDAEGMKYGIPIDTLRQFIKTAEIEKDIKITLL